MVIFCSESYQAIKNYRDFKRIKEQDLNDDRNLPHPYHDLVEDIRDIGK